MEGKENVLVEASREEIVDDWSFAEQRPVDGSESPKFG